MCIRDRNSIGLKEQEIAAKEQQITEKEAEIADQWGDVKQHMAAMQELRDGGSVAMLSAVNDLCAEQLRKELTRLVEFFGPTVFEARFTLAYEPDRKSVV